MSEGHDADHPICLGSYEDSERHRATGNALLKRGNAGGAEKCYGMALATASDVKQYSTALCNRAAARLVMKKYHGAQVDADRASKLDPENPKAFFRLGEAHRNLGDLPAAIEAYQQALFLAPGDKLITTSLADSRAALARTEEPEVVDLEDEEEPQTHPTPPTAKAKREEEKEVIDLDEEEEEEDEVLDIPDDVPLEPERPKAGVVKKKQQYSSDYSRFQQLSDEQSDDETMEQRVSRISAESADKTTKEKVEYIFRFFDCDMDQRWNYKEAGSATRMLEGKDLDYGLYRQTCEDHGVEHEAGWTEDVVTAIYVNNGSHNNLIGLAKHYSMVQAEERRRKGVVLQVFSPGDVVEGLVDGKWRPGTVHQRTAEGKYDIIWGDGTGTRDVPPENVRERFEGYRGPTGLRGEGKTLEAREVIDVRTGNVANKHHTNATSSRVSNKAKYGTDFSRFDKVGSEMLDDEEVNKEKLPEDPAKRLEITAERLGLTDEHTGLLDRDKLKQLIGMRTRV